MQQAILVAYAVIATISWLVAFLMFIALAMDEKLTFAGFKVLAWWSGVLFVVSGTLAIVLAGGWLR